MRQYLLTALVFLGLTASAQEKVTKDDLKNLRDRMEGTFDNQEQAALDDSYHNIVLHIKEIELKGKHPEGVWMYVEQAVASKPSEPYRQRIYHLFRQDNTTLVSKVYELHDPLRFAGAWQEPSRLKDLRLDSLIERSGCAVFLHKDEAGNYYGATEGKGCESTLEGATYASSNITIYPNMIVSWDRGFDSNDTQVWGAEKGGYRFRKFVQLRKPKD